MGEPSASSVVVREECIESYLGALGERKKNNKTNCQKARRFLFLDVRC